MKRSLFLILVLVVAAYLGSGCGLFINPADPGLVIYEYSVEINPETDPDPDPDPDPNVDEEPIFHFGVWGYVYLPSNPTVYYEGIEITLTVHIPDGESVTLSCVTDSDGYYEISFYDTVQHESLTAEVAINKSNFLPNEVSLTYVNGVLVEDDGDEYPNWVQLDFRNQTDIPSYHCGNYYFENQYYHIVIGRDNAYRNSTF